MNKDMRVDYNPWRVEDAVMVVVCEYAIAFYKDRIRGLWGRFREYEDEHKYMNDEGECWKLLNASFVISTEGGI